MLLDLAGGFSAGLAAEPVDLFAGGVDADIGAVVGELRIIFPGVDLFRHDLGGGRALHPGHMVGVAFAFAADGAGIIPPGRRAAVGKGIGPVGGADLPGELMVAAQRSGGGGPGLLGGIHIAAGISLDGIGDLIIVLAQRFPQGGRGGFGDEHGGRSGVKGPVAALQKEIGVVQRAAQSFVHPLDKGKGIHLGAEPELLHIAAIGEQQGEGFGAVGVVKGAVVRIQNDGRHIAVVIQAGKIIAVALVGPVQNDPIGGDGRQVVPVGLGLGDGRIHGPAGGGQRRGVRRLLHLQLRLFRLAEPLARDGQAHLQCGEIGRAGAHRGGHAVDGGGEGVRPHHIVAALVIGAVALGGVKGQLHIDQIGGSGAEQIFVVVSDHIVALPLGILNGGAIGHQVDAPAFDGFDGDLRLHLVGIARLGQLDDDVHALEPCHRRKRRRGQQRKDHGKTEQHTEQSFLHGISPPVKIKFNSYSIALFSRFCRQRHEMSSFPPEMRKIAAPTALPRLPAPAPSGQQKRRRPKTPPIRLGVALQA